MFGELVDYIMLANIPTSNDQGLSPSSPFIGTRPFLRTEAAYFFGREREATRLANMIAAGTMAILYGESGVGKSSLLNARLPIALEDIEPDWLVIAFFEWQPGFERRFSNALERKLDQTFDNKNVFSIEGLAKRLLDWTNTGERPLLLILDQFEEYFLYHPSGHPSFEAEIAKLVNRRSGGVRVPFCLARGCSS